MAGSYVFGKDRLGLWVISNSSLTDKLKHVLGRVRMPLPMLTDIYLPPEAQMVDKQICRDFGFFTNTYDVVHGRTPGDMAARMLALRNKLKTGAIEIDLEGAAVQSDIPKLAQWARTFISIVRKTNPHLPIRLNVPPFKGYALPIDIITSDPQVHVIAQAYHGNMDGRLSEADVLVDLLDWGVPLYKAQVMYGVMSGPDPNNRTVVLPEPNYKPLTTGSVFSDDLLLSSGLI